MAHRILITAGSGYLGGTLLARLGSANLPPYDKLFALVRTEDQAAAVRQYGAEPLAFDIHNGAAVEEAVVSNAITVVYYLPDALSPEPPAHFIQALASVKEKTGLLVHFLFTTGAKAFSSFAGAPTDRPIPDSDSSWHKWQKNQEQSSSGIQLILKGVKTNNSIIEAGERFGVRTYIFVPCIVYGEGEGFGNKISIQTVAIVKAAKALGRMYKFDQDSPSWPVCHVLDNTALYVEMLRRMIANEPLDYGKNGYYLAASGSVAWDDLYGAMATTLKERGIIPDTTISTADDAVAEKLAELNKCPIDVVPMSFGGRCTLTAEHGKSLGWKPYYPPEHILETARNEVKLILKNL